MASESTLDAHDSTANSAAHDDTAAPAQRLHAALTAFQSGNMRLVQLIEDVPTYIRDIDPPRATWKDEFVGYWWTLEQVHGEAIEEGESRRLPAVRRQAVDEAVAGMLQLAEECTITLQ